jgi:hypothetical protein
MNFQSSWRIWTGELPQYFVVREVHRFGSRPASDSWSHFDVAPSANSRSGPLSDPFGALRRTRESLSLGRSVARTVGPRPEQRSGVSALRARFHEGRAVHRGRSAARTTEHHRPRTPFAEKDLIPGGLGHAGAGAAEPKAERSARQRSIIGVYARGALRVVPLLGPRLKPPSTTTIYHESTTTTIVSQSMRRTIRASESSQSAYLWAYQPLAGPTGVSAMSS